MASGERPWAQLASAALDLPEDLAHLTGQADFDQQEGLILTTKALRLNDPKTASSRCLLGFVTLLGCGFCCTLGATAGMLDIGALQTELVERPVVLHTLPSGECQEHSR